MIEVVLRDLLPYLNDLLDDLPTRHPREIRLRKLRAFFHVDGRDYICLVLLWDVVCRLFSSGVGNVDLPHLVLRLKGCDQLTYRNRL